jgi:hypothetical protein
MISHIAPPTALIIIGGVRQQGQVLIVALLKKRPCSPNRVRTTLKRCTHSAPKNALWAPRARSLGLCRADKAISGGPPPRRDGGTGLVRVGGQR